MRVESYVCEKCGHKVNIPKDTKLWDCDEKDMDSNTANICQQVLIKDSRLLLEKLLQCSARRECSSAD
jgi:hypothetical protein